MDLSPSGSDTRLQPDGGRGITLPLIVEHQLYRERETHNHRHRLHHATGTQVALGAHRKPQDKGYLTHEQFYDGLGQFWVAAEHLIQPLGQEE